MHNSNAISILNCALDSPRFLRMQVRKIVRKLKNKKRSCESKHVRFLSCSFQMKRMKRMKKKKNDRLFRREEVITHTPPRGPKARRISDLFFTKLRDYRNLIFCNMATEIATYCISWPSFFLCFLGISVLFVTSRLPVLGFQLIP